VGISKWNAGIIRPVPVAPTGPYQTSAAPGVWTLDQQAYWQKQGLWPTQGNVDPSAFIENIFSTYLYTGTGAAQTITNGIDLAGKGGLVWLKNRTDGGSFHRLEDTVRGAGKTLYSNSTLAESSANPNLTSFNANGFSVTTGASSLSGQFWASWTFREQPKFFDIVTYTGSGVTGQIVPHNLGSNPGCVIVKQVGAVSNWVVQHRSVTSSQTLMLNSTAAQSGVGGALSTTDTDITVYGTSGTNPLAASGATYVAYLFAHNAGGFGLTGTDNVVSCGTYTGNGTATGPTVTLGYEPQWIMVKSSNNISNWIMLDNMRGVPTGGFDSDLYANLTYVGSPTVDFLDFTATGFIPKSNNSDTNGSGSTYIYIAIRRGPMAVPTLGTSVFSIDTSTTQSDVVSTLSFPDMGLFKDRTTVANWFVSDRLRGFSAAYYTPTLYTNLRDAEATPTTGDTITANGYNNKIYAGGAGVAGNYPLLYSFRRAPGFFDEVCYTGTGSVLNVSHNLGAVPELIIVKSRSNLNTEWNVYAAPLGATRYLWLQSTNAQGTGVNRWNNTAPTSSVFTVATDTSVNGSGYTLVAYLFATVAGVSKVGSYTGTAALQTIACGFTTGARYVLIKRTDSTGDWYVWDSVRGLTSGNDPYLLMNTAAAEVTGTNYVDTDTTGFKVTAAAPAALNAVGGTYIFLAIA